MRLILCALALLAFPSIAVGQQCGPTQMVEMMLSQRFGEVPTIGGLTADGKMMIVLWLNETTKSYSIVGTDPSDGKSCLLGGGIEWGAVLPVKPKGDPS